MSIEFKKAMNFVSLGAWATDTSGKMYEAMNEAYGDFRPPPGPGNNPRELEKLLWRFEGLFSSYRWQSYRFGRGQPINWNHYDSFWPQLAEQGQEVIEEFKKVVG